MAVEYIAWALEQDLPSGPKFVLVALANRANQDGDCWPSQNDISRQTGISRMSVSKHITYLVEKKLIEAKHRKRIDGGQSSNFYTLCKNTRYTHVTQDDIPLSNFDTPPVKPVYTPCKETLHPPVKQLYTYETSLEPSIEPSKNIRARKRCIKPDDVTEQVWNDFEQLRKQKKAPITATVLSRIRSEAEKAGWSMEEALAECCARGWQGFKADWILRDKDGGNKIHMSKSMQNLKEIAENGW